MGREVNRETTCNEKPRNMSLNLEIMDKLEVVHVDEIKKESSEVNLGEVVSKEDGFSWKQFNFQLKFEGPNDGDVINVNSEPVLTSELIIKEELFLSNTDELIEETTKNQHFYCALCHAKFINKQNLVKHLQPRRSNGLKCNVCDFKCLRNCMLKEHKKLYHTGERPFHCSICKKNYQFKSRFQRHSLTHSKEKPFQCTICRSYFAEKSYLKIHIKTHTGEKPFKCELCGHQNIRKWDLERHMKVHTGDKPFSCNLCSYKCVRNADLQKHLKIHTGEKPYKCDQCEYKCILKTALEQHMLKHTGEKPFKCYLCSYESNAKSNLLRHVKTHKGMFVNDFKK